MTSWVSCKLTMTLEKFPPISSQVTVKQAVSDNPLLSSDCVNPHPSSDNGCCDTCPHFREETESKPSSACLTAPQAAPNIPASAS